MRSTYLVFAAVAAVLLTVGSGTYARADSIGINVLLTRAATPEDIEDLGTHGVVLEELPEIHAVTMRTSQLAAIRALSFVATAEPDCLGQLAGHSSRALADLSGGANLWNLDAINVTDFGVGRTVGFDGIGVFIAVLDSGLPYNWREYFPEDRIAIEFARCFGGGGGNKGTVSSQPERWEHDTDGHGTRVTSVLLGCRYAGPLALPTTFNGVAPGAKVIPVNLSSFDHLTDIWSSVVSRALVYVTNLKVGGVLGKAPLVVNMSVGYPSTDPVLKAAVDYAIAKGVVVVSSAGNEGEAGMRFPARYPPVISVAAAAWKRQFAYDDPTQIEWIFRDVTEADPEEILLTPFSSRELPGQELDIAAPGAAIPTALTLDGRVDYVYFNGTSAACPHVAGVAALMLQKNPSLTQTQIEFILKATAMPLAPSCRDVRVRIESQGRYPTFSDLRNLISFDATVCWGANSTGAGLVQADAALAATPFP